MAAPFFFVAADREWPGEIEDAMPETRLMLSIVHSQILHSLRSITTPAICTLALVLSTSPDVPEEQHLGMELRSADADLSSGGGVELVLNHLSIDVETFPADRMTPRSFPGLTRWRGGQDTLACRCPTSAGPIGSTRARR